MQPWIQILLSSILLFSLLILSTRLMGRRNLARMMPYRYVSYIIIAVIIAIMSLNMITELTYGLIALAVWILLPVGVDYLCLKSKWMNDTINGKELVVIKEGKVLEENLFKAKLTGEELLRELRFKNAFNLADVEFAVMEDCGDLNVLMKASRTPVSPYDLGIKVNPQAEPQTVILDGNILNDSLSSLGFNCEWLGIQLESMGVSLDNIFIGQLDSSGDLYLDLFDDKIKLPQPKVKEMLYANFEKAQADLLSFALETQNETARTMYFQHANHLKQVMEKLRPYLLR